MDIFTAYGTCVMAFMAPTLAFISVNRPICLVRQMVLSLVLAAFLGCLLAWGLTAVQAHPLVIAGTGTAAFLACSERMLSELLPRPATRRWTVLAILSLGICLAWIWPPLLPIVFGLHMLLSLRDLRRNWNRPPFYGQFPFESFACGSASSNDVPQEAQGLTFRKKRNIYVLFMESLHSRDALRDLYGSDDFGLSSYLEKHDFKIYDNAFSNHSYTVASLFSIVHMMHRFCVDSRDLSIPQCFTILKKNGYEISAFDSSLYVFFKYIKYLNYINFDLKLHVKFLYEKFLPFFMQSQFMRNAVGGDDPYMTASPFSKIMNDVKKYVSDTHDKSRCAFIRFGAYHADFRKSFEELQKDDDEWRKLYVSLYEKAVKDIVEMVDFLIDQDPESIILIAGDHGAKSFGWAWGTDGGCNANIRANGLEPGLVARDFCEVLVACRCPDGPILREPVAHVNFFRDIFTALGCDPQALEPRSRPYSLVLPDPYAVQQVAVRDGVVLKDWEPLPAEEVADLLFRYARNAPDRVDTHLFLAGMCENSGDYATASRMRMQLQRDFPDNALATDAWFQELLLQGRTQDARTLLERAPAAPRSEDRLFWRIWLHALEGDMATARKLLASPAAWLHLGRVRRAKLKVLAELLSGDEQSAMQRAAGISPMAGMDAGFLLACAFTAMGGRDETTARRWIGALHGGGDDAVRKKIALASLHADGFDWAAREADIREATALPGLKPVILDIWLAGVLERQERHGDAAKVLLDAAQEQPIPSLLEQAGLFFLRRGFQGVPGETAVFLRSHAYAAMARENDLLATPFLFDAEFYARKYGALLGDMPPLRHFLSFGLMLGLDPNSLFNTMWNLAWSPAHAAVGTLPLTDFLKAPIRAGWPSSPTFWPVAWCARHPECLEEGIHPMLHALKNASCG